MPDRVDLRDWMYQPTLQQLPDICVNCEGVPQPILDQGNEGACTGYALAAVINYLLNARGLLRPGDTGRLVSPRMLYEMARRYDEWPGEAYEGSSARGGMKGWVSHGVCRDLSWPKKGGKDLPGPGNLSPELAKEAQLTIGGAYYRVAHKQIRDMHCALNEVGILYATLMVHRGWDVPGMRSDGSGPHTTLVSYTYRGNAVTRELPVIQRIQHAEDGHAIAIVGYTREGFVIQNSWGSAWGNDGFALLPYEDYMLHATDVWVAQLGVPIEIRTWEKGGADTVAGLTRAASQVPLADIRPFVVDVGNNGELSDSGNYWTTEADLARLFNEVIPEATSNWKSKQRRILLYLHGGLNPELAVAKRILAFRDVLLDNEIYPVHIMWESGLGESLTGIIEDLFTDTDDEAKRAGNWFGRFREGLIEAKDRAFEMTAAVPGGALWREMKENAELLSRHPDGRGGMQLIAKHAAAALNTLPAAERNRWELHVAAHSAGSIVAAHALQPLGGIGIQLKTLQFMAPAITTDTFSRLVLPRVKAQKCPHPTVYNLSDVGERDDDVGLYGKSLLYLVSNAFEGRRGVPLLGMETYINSDASRGGKDVPPGFDPVLAAFFKQKVNSLPSLVIAGRNEGPGCLSRSETHGAFDNDPDTLNSILYRILGGPPVRPFESRDLQY